MAAATVSIAESNTLSETVTQSITNLNIGSTDAVNLVALTYPLSQSSRSYQKWVRFNVSANGSGNTIKNLRVWISTGANPQDSVTLRTNCTTAAYGGAQTFDAVNGPQATDEEVALDYDHDAPVADPSANNLGIGGSLTGEITTTGYSDYCIIQGVVTTPTDGDTVTWTFQYDEVA
jgi:hypothetical protein